MDTKLERAKRATEIIQRLLIVRQIDPEGYAELLEDYDITAKSLVGAGYEFADKGLTAENFNLSS